MTLIHEKPNEVRQMILTDLLVEFFLGIVACGLEVM